MTSAAAVADTLTRKGQAVTIEGASSGTYDTGTGGVTATPYNSTGSAVLLPLNPLKLNLDGVQAGDEQMLLSALIAKPPIGALVTAANGAKFSLIAVDALHPAGDELLFDCVVRARA